MPKERYRSSLAALEDYCKTTFAGKGFAALTAVQHDQVLTGLENGEIKLKDGSGKAFFEAILANTIEGFFADPIYGGNRDMAGWKLIGFPGARYDYRDHIAKHNQPYPATASLDPRAQRVVSPGLRTRSYSWQRSYLQSDVAIIGLGWTGAILAQELTDQGLDVVAIERGPWRDTATSFHIGYAPDELRYGVKFDLCQQTAQGTLTFRNNDRETALPIRQWGSFQPGNGVGGAGVHWGGQTWRHMPTDFLMRSHLTERYGASFIPGELSIQDWGVTYDEMEPFYDRFEYLCGISGKAGNLNGVIQAGGNPFEGPRKREYPLPPMQMTYAPTLFAEAARSVGYHPFPSPSATPFR